MRIALMTIALLALTQPAQAQAQDALTADSLLQTFTDRCATIAADPEAALAANADGERSGAMTTDKALLQLTNAFELPGTSVATLFYTRVILPADKGDTCSLTVSFDEPGNPVALPEMVDLLETRSADLLGAPVTRHGSDIFADGELARFYIWSTGDSVNDPSLLVTQTSNYVLLTVNRRHAAN